MSATKTEAKAEFHCSCGRTFAHEISLKRHCWVTGHTAAEVAAPEAAPAPVEVPAPVVSPVEVTLAAVDVVDEALRILREKQQAQAAYEARAERERQVRAALQCAQAVVQQGVQKAAETTREGVEVVRQSTLLALRMFLMLLLCSGLLLAGMGVGRLLATPADAAPAPAAAERQLVGHQSHP